MLGVLKYICDWSAYFKETVMLFPAKREKKWQVLFLTHCFKQCLPNLER